MLRQLYDYVLRLASHKHAPLALFLVAFTESSFFPIPPDVLLIPMILVNFRKAFHYAAICTAGSVLGGLFGYGIGALFAGTLGEAIISFYHAEAHFAQLQTWYDENLWLVVGAAGFSPIPYKIFTILSGVMEGNIFVFILASIISRGARFFLIAYLLWRGGTRLKDWIDRNFYPLTLIGTLVLITLVVIVKVIL